MNDIKEGHIQMNSTYFAVYDGDNYHRIQMTFPAKLQLLADLSQHVASEIRKAWIADEKEGR